MGKSPIVQAHSVFHIEIDRYFSDNILNFSHKRSFPRRDIRYFTTYTCKLKISIGELVWMYIAISIFSLKFECMCMLAGLLGEVRVGFYSGLDGKIRMKLSILGSFCAKTSVASGANELMHVNQLILPGKIQGKSYLLGSLAFGMHCM